MDIQLCVGDFHAAVGQFMLGCAVSMGFSMFQPSKSVRYFFVCLAVGLGVGGVLVWAGYLSWIVDKLTPVATSPWSWFLLVILSPIVSPLWVIAHNLVGRKILPAPVQPEGGVAPSNRTSRSWLLWGRRDNQPIHADDWKGYLLTLVEGKTFKSETIKLDGYRYNNCSFVDVTFEYGGTAPFEVVNSTTKPRTVFIKSSHSFVNHLQYFIHDLYVTSGYTQKR